MYAPELQAAYENFGCNEGDIFVLGIDKGNTNQSIIYFDSITGVTYPQASGYEGNGNYVHQLYDMQGTPSVVVIAPDRLILEQTIYPPTTVNITVALLSAGALQQPCTTGLEADYNDEKFSLYPNPVKNYAEISFNLTRSRNIAVKVYNLTGQIIAGVESNYYLPGLHRQNIDLSDKPNGFYFVQFLENDKVIETKKVILNK